MRQREAIEAKVGEQVQRGGGGMVFLVVMLFLFLFFFFFFFFFLNHFFALPFFFNSLFVDIASVVGTAKNWDELVAQFQVNDEDPEQQKALRECIVTVMMDMYPQLKREEVLVCFC